MTVNRAKMKCLEVVHSLTSNIVSKVFIFSLFSQGTFHMNHCEKVNPPGTKPSGQVSPNEIHIRGADIKRERKRGSGDRPGKILRAYPSDRWK